ncbi:tryptophan synthase subunit alpha [Lachnoclostridium sp. An181]|uniref:tryptophan synthase subunit alpha n=1 Tax=Lachnoclostridium sp. An181 TaxID=1965575 RepID=UPI000B372086|nr:tryptophan synthase subunit alpha [Lachnoclostridium sp. An181]OUP51162.1 tryptophan synthase subunit alpha [Lachnoclostridium sp. An181]
MNKIAEAFQNKKAFIPFITAGDPSLEMTEQLLYTMQKAGADLIEIGIPFSDPVAEGVVIQEANERALKQGCTTDKIFDMLSRARERVTVPLVFLTYLNPIYTYGKERFMQKCAECKIDGLIVPDMPYEEREELQDVCKKYDIKIISLIAPTSKERIAMIASKAEGYLYCVSSLGVTGIRKEIKTDIADMVAHIRETTDIPCAVGFGIASTEQAKEMAALSDGAIVGSAIVKLIGEYKENALAPVEDYVRMMKQAVQDTEE